MSDRTEKSIARSEQPIVTPEPDDEALFDFVEEKFKDRDSFPRYFRVHIAYGTNNREYRPEIIYEKEFKATQAPPTKPELVTIANYIFGVAQHNCNQLTRPVCFWVMATNPTKGSEPYGAHFMRMRPTLAAMREAKANGAGTGGERGDDESGETLSTTVHWDRLMTHSLEHQKSNDEHTRFMQDAHQKTMGTMLGLMDKMITDLRTENHAYRARELDYFSAMEQAKSQVQEREIKAQKHKVLMDLVERGAAEVSQWMPVLAKSLERNKTNALPASSDAITPSPESIAISNFAKALSEDQKAAIFGYFDEEKKHVPGIFTAPQVNVISRVAECLMVPETLALLMPGAEFELTSAQIDQVQKHVPLSQLAPLYAVLVKEPQAKAEAQG